jgi:hypothetical protein
MKKMLLAVTLAFAATAAQADIVSGGLRLTDGSGSFNGTPLTQVLESKEITPSVGDDGWGGNGSTLQPAGLYTGGNYGMLVANQDTSVAFTFLGKVAGFENINAYANGSVLNDLDVGATYTVEGLAAGERLKFGFQTLTEGFNATVVNGQANLPQIGIMFFDATAWNKLYDTNFDFLIGYNDPANVNADYDDMVIGVQAVPVPAALPLMASALGMFGVARRRKTLA